MDAWKILSYAAVAIVGTIVTAACVRLIWPGQRTADMSAGIRVEDAGWLSRYLGRLTDQQLRDGLSASGASEEDADSFAASLRERIEQLRRAGSETRQP